MKYRIIDNFLPEEVYNTVNEVMLGNEIDWNFCRGVNRPNDGFYQFTHVFYSNHQPVSRFYPLIEPIVDQIDPAAIVRIKANMHVQQPELIQHDFHHDVDNCITAIYYVNTNNGKTVFENGLEVDSVGNRLLVFDSNEEHTGTTSTDTLQRCVINFNYFVQYGL
tara:strand:- start:47 stop:538 length:492 start_codon:yes stop_codon:yes gene_type:complete